MFDLTAHKARMDHIRKEHWTRHETDREHEDRADAAESTAGWYFRECTKPQAEAYQQALRDLVGLTAPRDERAREAALDRFHRDTTTTRDLMAETFEMVMRDGDVSEAMSARWDAIAERSAAEAAVGDVIVTTNVFPPIPDRRFDWCATRNNDEPNDNGSMLAGYGPTEAAAIADLVEQHAERV